MSTHFDNLHIEFSRINITNAHSQIYYMEVAMYVWNFGDYLSV